MKHTGAHVKCKKKVRRSGEREGKHIRSHSASNVSSSPGRSDLYCMLDCSTSLLCFSFFSSPFLLFYSFLSQVSIYSQWFVLPVQLWLSAHTHAVRTFCCHPILQCRQAQVIKSFILERRKRDTITMTEHS